MQFKVPQFLDIEDKIFGPFTFREFVYLAGGAGLCFIFYKLLGLLLGAIPILIIAGFSGMLIFYHPNNKPFLNMIESGFKYFSQNKLYIWKRKVSKKTSPPAPLLGGVGGQRPGEVVEINRSKLTGSRLRDLAWSLDVLDINKREADKRAEQIIYSK